jgi:putative tryptophan/tyrosine transport system substrate-binding protein
MLIVKNFFIIALVFIIATFSTEALAKNKIGILIWSEEGRYVEANQGFMEQLKKDGFAEAQVDFTIENANGNKVKAAELAQKFASRRMDMVVAVGLSAAIAVSKEIKDVPVVLNYVYDPVDAKIAQSWQSSGNNTTGTSPKFPMSKLVSYLKQLAPVKKLAVLYTSGEKNSEAQLKEFLAIQEDSQIKVVPVDLSRQEDVTLTIPDVCQRVDAIYFSGSNIVSQAATMIVDMAAKAKVVTVTHLEDLVAKGVLLGVYADPLAVGHLAGKKAAKILKGAKPSSIPIESVKELELVLNMKTAKASRIDVPPAFLKIVTRVIE